MNYTIRLMARVTLHNHQLLCKSFAAIACSIRDGHRCCNTLRNIVDSDNHSYHCAKGSISSSSVAESNQSFTPPYLPSP